MSYIYDCLPIPEQHDLTSIRIKFISYFFWVYLIPNLWITVSDNHSSFLWRSVLLGRQSTSKRAGTCTNSNISAQCREPFKCYKFHAPSRGISYVYGCIIPWRITHIIIKYYSSLCHLKLVIYWCNGVHSQTFYIGSSCSFTFSRKHLLNSLFTLYLSNDLSNHPPYPPQLTWNANPLSSVSNQQLLCKVCLRTGQSHPSVPSPQKA